MHLSALNLLKLFVAWYLHLNICFQKRKLIQRQEKEAAFPSVTKTLGQWMKDVKGRDVYPSCWEDGNEHGWLATAGWNTGDLKGQGASRVLRQGFWEASVMHPSGRAGLWPWFALLLSNNANVSVPCTSVSTFSLRNKSDAVNLCFHWKSVDPSCPRLLVVARAPLTVTVREWPWHMSAFKDLLLF